MRDKQVRGLVQLGAAHAATVEIISREKLNGFEATGQMAIVKDDKINVYVEMPL